ncbi:MAG: VanW family protein [Coriobacteriia bacterium]|nr:VanW family protein [Coriobacteriia bacterium]
MTDMTEYEDEPVTATSDAKRPGLWARFRTLDPKLRWSIVVLTAVVLVLGALVGVDILLSAGRVHPGVRVGTVAVGGMTQSEAAIAVRQGFEPLLSEPATLTVGDAEWPVDAQRVGATVESTRAAEAAYAIGRGDSFGAVVGDRLSAWFGDAVVPLPITADDALLSAFFDAVSATVAQPAVDASVVIDGTSVRLEPSATGLDIDRESAREDLLAMFASETRVLVLQLEPSLPRIDEAAAQQALDDARLMVDGPLTLTYEDSEWTVPAEDIGEWIAFRSEPETGTPTAQLVAVIASEDVSATVLPMVADVGKVATNASFKASSGKVTIVPHQDGLAVDAADLATELTTRLTCGERTVELKMHRVEPEITTEDAEAMGIKDRLSTFTTDYSASNLPRVNNIHTLTDALDGTLLAPGETFSFNGTIGERTAEKGYQEANAIVNGKLVPQLGGGICQVGTTIFNTVFFSGLPVVERHNHSQYISHYPTGRDATVSWGGPDFKFKNDTENWVLIATSYTNSTVTISLYGTDQGYDVSYKTGDWTNITPYAVREIEDASMTEGMKVVEERGVTGRTITVTRTVTKDGSVVREDSFKSVYRGTEEVIRVGTKPATSSTTTSTP